MTKRKKKKRTSSIFSIIAVILLIVGISGFVAKCDDGKKEDLSNYSITINEESIVF